MFATGGFGGDTHRYQHGGASASPRPLYRHQTQEMPPPSPVPEQQQPRQQSALAEEEQQLSLEPVEKTPSKERPGAGDDGSVYWPYFQSSPWNQHDVLTIQPSQIMHQYDEPSGVNALPTTPRARQHQQNLQQAFIAA